MQVETYETLTIDVTPSGAVVNEVVSEEALALIEAMSLEGQRTLVEIRTTESGETVESRIPYRKLTLEEYRVYATLFPRCTKLADYKYDAIPLRALQVSAHALDLGLTLYILHPDDRAVQVDPVLVGLRQQGNQWERFLLARWGEAVESLEVLRAQAITKLGAQWEREAERHRKTFQAVKESAHDHAAAWLHGEEVDLPTWVIIQRPTYSTPGMP